MSAMMHDVSNNLKPPNISTLFTRSNTVHHYSTRFSSKNNLYIKHEYDQLSTFTVSTFYSVSAFGTYLSHCFVVFVFFIHSNYRPEDSEQDAQIYNWNKKINRFYQQRMQYPCDCPASCWQRCIRSNRTTASKREP